MCVNNFDQVGTALGWHRARVRVPPVPAVSTHQPSVIPERSDVDHDARVAASEVQKAVLLVQCRSTASVTPGELARRPFHSHPVAPPPIQGTGAGEAAPGAVLQSHQRHAVATTSVVAPLHA